MDAVLTNVVLGYNLDQQFSGHHLFPDVSVNDMAGKTLKFGKEAFVVVNSKTAPGETIRGVVMNYSSDVYELNLRKLSAMATIEEIESADKLKAVKFKFRAVAQVMQRMRLEGEYDMAQLATNGDNYLPNQRLALSGASQWDDPTANIDAQIEDAKAEPSAPKSDANRMCFISIITVCAKTKPFARAFSAQQAKARLPHKCLLSIPR